ncbi:FMN adenylyltransferase /riboflavin kinase [Nitrosomonas sp. PY1]|uniref:bifunctional riboflavin kinase/FAD synthetase n=1 Tax=Nitrosomonas sp. PY1 TaxID=1803906 RepID=UPI001FC8C4C1|nr:bifunctional riboflavin kinase/FAD synthetase [Nitrosomonas sp. PY1]GKS69111.1 FMN adenylyltransferase /riboflavin kinase [Nitrosomonas sp. PY1]
MYHTWRRSFTRCNTPIALTIGNFDGVHLGHQAILSRLKQIAKNLHIPACVMTFEPHPREFFTPDHVPARLTCWREKLLLLNRLDMDYIHTYRFTKDFAKVTAEQFISQILVQQLAVKWLLVGDDFRFGAGRKGDFSMLQARSIQHGFEVEAMSSVLVDGKRVSSTSIRQALTDNDLATAQGFLGRPYSLIGRVIKGEQLGRKIGFPTANIAIHHHRPKLTGIFAVAVHGAIDTSPTTVLPAVASLGVRPTVCENGQLLLEIHLFDFKQNIYGRRLQVDFLYKLRDEEKFSDLATLTEKIKQDVDQAKKFFLMQPIDVSRLCNAS